MATLLKNISGTSVQLLMTTQPGQIPTRSFKPDEIISSDNVAWEDHIVQPYIDQGILTIFIKKQKITINIPATPTDPGDPNPPTGPWVVTLDAAYPQSATRVATFSPAVTSNLPLEKTDWTVALDYNDGPWFTSLVNVDSPTHHPYAVTPENRSLLIMTNKTAAVPSFPVPSDPNKISTAVVVGVK